MHTGAIVTGHLPWLELSLLGLVVGLMAGMFGVGGGFLLIPLLNVLFGFPINIAIGSGICQTIGTAVAAFRRHHRLKQGEVKIDWIMMAGSLLGVEAGARTVAALFRLGAVEFRGHTVPAAPLYLSLVYVVVLTAVGAWMLHGRRGLAGGESLPPGFLTRIRIPPFTHLPVSDRSISVFVLAYTGLVLGFLSGLMGFGGGVILVPVLVYGIGMPIRVAAGTGILLLLATSVAGTLAHARLGHVNLGISMALLAGSTLGAPIGATLTSRLDPRRLRGIFAGLVFLTALVVLWNIGRSL